MNTTIASPEVSGQHAVIHWNGSHWVLRDLGSRNGTTLNGVAVTAGDDVVLSTGDTLNFGGAAPVYTLHTDTEPSPVAVSGNIIREGDGELLALPDSDNPVAVVDADGLGGWVLRHRDDERSVVTGDTVQVDNITWTLDLPEILDLTVEAQTSNSIADASIAFRVSADEEYVEVYVTLDGTTTALKPRAQHYLLLTLARQRTADADEGLPVSERGWLTMQQLEKMLRASANQVYVSLHRLRKEFAQFDVADAGEVIEKRATTRQVRMGIANLKVSRLQ
jgi:hypothetical protein